MELKVTKERVLAAASKCSTAKATLKELFPEAFENEIKVIEGGVYSYAGYRMILARVARSDDKRDYSLVIISGSAIGNRWAPPEKLGVAVFGIQGPSAFKFIGMAKDVISIDV